MSSNDALTAIMESVFASSLTPSDQARIARAGRNAAVLSTAVTLAAVGAGLAVLIDDTSAGASLGFVMLGVSVVPLLLVTLVLLPGWVKSNVRKRILRDLYPSDD